MTAGHWEIDRQKRDRARLYAEAQKRKSHLRKNMLRI
jgi:predicted nucleotidyltransferase